MAVTTDFRSSRKKNKNPIAKLVQKQLPIVLPPIAAIAGFLIIWQILCPPGSKGLPGPLQVWNETLDPYITQPFFDNGGSDKGLGLHIFASLQRVAIGFSLSAIVGIGLGVLIGINKFFHRALDPAFQIMRTIAPLAWLPIAQAGFSDNARAAIFVIFITAIWPIIINTAEGVKNIPQDYRNVARVLRLPPKKYFLKILFPAAVPYIFTGLRIAIGLSWLAIVAAEMLMAGGVGIGSFIIDAFTSSLIAQIIVAVVYIGIIGFILDRLVGFIGSLLVTQEQK
jgi:nitrate/nitrite transport system permease protein